MARDLLALIRQKDIENCAEQISDPIQRLRFLRQATASGRKPLSRRYFGALGLALAALPLRSDSHRRTQQTPTPRAAAVRPPVADTPNVWPVEHTDEHDLYSNGLRVENGLEVANKPRSYALIFRDSEAIGPRRSQPAGIVFHSTESDQAPFESTQKRALKRIGKDVLLFVRQKRAYHFVIDRFGRVHRIVSESDTANHAGHSVWADSRWVYVDLNTSFIGVAFESNMGVADEPLTDAQLRAARALTELLRAKYAFPAQNCVTHAQVSVNPSNMRIGWHTDWGARFPFKELGLPNNYEIPSPSLYYFGFEYDPVYVKSTNADVWKALTEAEERIRIGAEEQRISITEYRRMLRTRYRKAEANLHYQDAGAGEPI